jgi:drug/metabolite transporter (DMT)-like permease
MLGAIYATLAALTFAMNNAAMRRGVLTGTAVQAIALTVPLGGLCFLVMAIVTGEIWAINSFPFVAACWLAAQGVLQFVVGRYFNYEANRLVGVNISAPVVQLQVIVTMLLAVVLLKEEFTVLQAIGTVLMLGGSFGTQLHKPVSPASTRSQEATTTSRTPNAKPAFKPRYLPGVMCGLGAAIAYGVAPLLVRAAFESTPVKNILAGGVIAYATATIVLLVLVFFLAPVRQHIRTVNRHSATWFAAAAALVAASHGFVYASLAVAPLMVVTPILQLSLIFRIFLSQLLNREYEIMNAAVIIGSIVAVVGSIGVSMNTDYLLAVLRIPPFLVDILRVRLDAGI